MSPETAELVSVLWDSCKSTVWFASALTRTVYRIVMDSWVTEDETIQKHVAHLLGVLVVLALLRPGGSGGRNSTKDPSETTAAAAVRKSTTDEGTTAKKAARRRFITRKRVLSLITILAFAKATQTVVVRAFSTVMASVLDRLDYDPDLPDINALDVRWIASACLYVLRELASRLATQAYQLAKEHDETLLPVATALACLVGTTLLYQIGKLLFTATPSHGGTSRSRTKSVVSLLTLLAAVGALGVSTAQLAHNKNGSSEHYFGTFIPGGISHSNSRPPPGKTAPDSDPGTDSYEPPGVEFCRRRPTWKRQPGDGDEIASDAELREQCQSLFSYAVDPEALPHPLPHPLYRELAACVDKQLAGMPRETATKGGSMKKPRIAELHRGEGGKVLLAVVEDALSPEEARVVEAVSHCTHQHVPANRAAREHEDLDATVLAGFLQLLAPGIAFRVQDTAKRAWHKAGWWKSEERVVPIDAQQHHPQATGSGSEYSTRAWPDPVYECGILDAQHLSYNGWYKIDFPSDQESEYTVVMTLSDAEEGDSEGSFFLCPEEPGGGDDDDLCPGKIAVLPKKHSALVFLSGTFHHGMESAEIQGRSVFTSELWRYNHVPATMRRPTASEFVLGIDETEDSGDDDGYSGYYYYGEEDGYDGEEDEVGEEES